MGNMTSKINNQLPLTTWRYLIAIKIVRLDYVGTGLRRNIQFVAIGILDKFINNIIKKNLQTDFSLESVIPTTIALVIIACKFNGNYVPKGAKLLQYCGEKCDYAPIKLKWLEVEKNIYAIIQFDLPLETAFTKLEEISDNIPPQEDISQKKTLNYLIWGLIYSSELSMNPDYGSRIYQIIKLHQKDQNIFEYLKRLRSWRIARNNSISLS